MIISNIVYYGLNIKLQMSYTIEDYSEKAIAVFGDLARYEEMLTNMKGTKNERLKDPTDENKRRVGFIFAKAKRADVEKALKEFGTKNVSASSSSVSTQSVTPTTTTNISTSADQLIIKQLQTTVQDLQRRLDAAEAEIGALTKLVTGKTKAAKPKATIDIEDEVFETTEPAEEEKKPVSILKSLRRKGG